MRLSTTGSYWIVLFLSACLAGRCYAQDLAPRAYVISPLRTNAVILAYSFYDGSLDFNGVVPVTGATGKYSVSIFSYYHSFSFFGRSANFTGSLPYAVGTFQGSVLGAQREAYRSGLADTSFRLSVNLKGGPAIPLQEFAKWRQTTILGLSLRVIAPTGQYDPTKLISWSINRWAFKPEFGYSRRLGNWVLDGYGGVWFYTTNDASFSIPTPQPQTQAPIGSLEGHLSYDFARQRLWVSLDGNFWFGGTTSLNGVSNPATKQSSSRLGATASFPVTGHSAIKASYSRGAYVRFGGNYHNLAVAWQYSWFGRPN